MNSPRGSAGQRKAGHTADLQNRLRISFGRFFRTTSAGDPPGRRSHASNMFLVNRCWVLGSRDSTVNSCIPCGSYGTHFSSKIQSG
jgi:hypothetical protein